MSDKQKIYLITDGEYSDYHIVGAYSTRENAEKMLGYVSGDIEGWTLDDGIDKICAGRKLTYVEIRRDGSIDKTMHDSGIDVGATLLLGYRSEPALRLKCWAKDFAHAVHIAGEARRVLLAENLWPKSFDEYKQHPFYAEFDKHLGAALDRAVAVVEERES